MPSSDDSASRSRDPLVRWGGPLALGAAALLLVAFALAWLSQWDAPPDPVAGAPVPVDRPPRETTPTPPWPPNASPHLVDQPTPDAPDYARLVAVFPGPESVLTGPREFVFEIAYLLQTAPAADLRVSLGEFDDQPAGVATAVLVPARRLSVTTDGAEQRAIATASWALPAPDRSAAKSLQLQLELIAEGDGRVLFRGVVPDVAWTMEPRLADTAGPTDLQILWLDSCDPRTDPEVCQLSDSVDIMAQFYALVEEIGATLTYRVPEDVAVLLEFDVVIANFCGRGGRSLFATERYLQAGGSVVAMGDGFCRGVEDGEGRWTSSAALANLLAEPRGIHVSEAETTADTPLLVARTHPVTAGVAALHMPRASLMTVQSPAEALVVRDGEPQLAVFDEAGTLVVIPRVGFAWSMADAPPNDNFLLWHNLLLWLGQISRVKRTAAALPAGTDTAPTLEQPPFIQIGRQEVGPANEVTVATVYAPDGGWLALHEGAPRGPVVAYARLRRGNNSALRLELKPGPLPAELWAVLHEDTGESGRFDFPEADPPVTWQDQEIAALFGLEPVTPTPLPPPTPWYTPTP